MARRTLPGVPSAVYLPPHATLRRRAVAPATATAARAVAAPALGALALSVRSPPMRRQVEVVRQAHARGDDARRRLAALDPAVQLARQTRHGLRGSLGLDKVRLSARARVRGRVGC